jgi:hypothetical protein
VRYEPARVATLSRGCQTGTHALAAAIKVVWPELRSLTNVYGCWNPRHIAGSSTWSLHAEGRACDVGVPLDANELGWNLACDLVAERRAIGTMRVIWDRHIWSTEKPDQWRRLQPSTNQHLDHIHVEQFWSAARRPRTVQAELEHVLLTAR